MPMTGREIVERAINFDRPPRVAMSLPEPYPNDIVTTACGPHPDFVEKRWTEGDNECWTDEWGCTWCRIGGISKGEVVGGAIDHWDQLDDYRAPDYGLEARYDRVRSALAAHPDKYVIVGLPGGWVFATARKIRRMQNYLADLIADRPRIEQLHDLIVVENEKVIRRAAQLGAQAVMVWEDWGTQTQPLVSPAMFRDIFKPRTEHLCRLAHSLGLACWMHSCGKMTQLIPDLIEAGVEVFQFDQPALHGVDLLDREFGGQAAFWCPADIQSTLQTRDAEKIRAEAKALCEKLGGHNGGFVAGYYGDNVAIGLDPSVQDIACRAFVEFGGGATVRA